MDAAQPDVLDRLARNGPYDFIYDCCSAPNLLLEVFEKQLLAFGGTVGLMAVRDRVTYPWSLLHMTQGRIETSCHFDTDDLRVLRFLFEEKLLRTEPMLSHLVAVERAPSIYELLANRPDELLGVVFDWTGTQG
jgi:threonine dehydrogenase-like Zn-dependent dehydrogenase